MQDPDSITDPAAAFTTALEGLGIAACVFDEQDRTRRWNRVFLEFFPEHDGHVYDGEPYRANLLRFYQVRLEGAERERIERYVEDGVARHRAQSRPFSFLHRGRWLRVASAPVAGGGRIRVWQDETHLRAPGLPVPLGDLGSQDAFLGNADAFDHVPDGIAVAAADGAIAWVNLSFRQMYGLADRRSVGGRSFDDIYRQLWRDADEAGRASRDSGLATLAGSLAYAGAPFELPLPGGRWVRVIEQRRPEGSRVFAHVDITELKRQQLRLAEAEARARDSERLVAEKTLLLEAALERMDQGVVMVNAQRIVEVCNRRAMELLSLPEALMRSRPRFEDVLAYQWAHNEFARTSQDLQDFVRRGGILDTPHRYDRRRPDGSVIEVQSVPIEGGGVLRTYTDITERKRIEERMLHQAQHDGLTSLVNRETFLERLAAAAQGGERFAVHYIDLDRFKEINDTLGHAVGDKVLAETAGRLRALARGADVVARLGGDEFAVLQRGVERLDAALGLALRIQHSLSQPVRADLADAQNPEADWTDTTPLSGPMPLRASVGASVGIALCPGDGADADTLVRHADAAMYAAKTGGRGMVRAYAELAPDERRRRRRR